MNEVSMIGLDTAKNVFQLCGLNTEGAGTLERRLKRVEVAGFFRKLPPCTVALEACGGSHHWARTLLKLGHRVHLIAPQFVKRFAEGRRKTDQRDAKAVAFAAKSPDLRPVPVKSEEEQAQLAVLSARRLLVNQRTQTGNALRGHLCEFGLVARTGDSGLEGLLNKLEAGEIAVPKSALEAIAALAFQWRGLGERIARLTSQLTVAAKANTTTRRLMQVPGVGPIIATAFVLKVPEPQRFASARNCAAWLGLVCNERSSGSKRRLGGITKAGDEDLRMLLVQGAAARIVAAKRKSKTADPTADPKAGPKADPKADPTADLWLRRMIAEKPFKVAAVALAARMARTLWAMLNSGADYSPKHQAQSC
jgi:transposase